MFAPLLLTSLPVKAAKLLTMANIMPVYVVCREHLGASKKGNSIKGISLSIRDHSNDIGHSASFDNFYILDHSSNDADLRIPDILVGPRLHYTR